MKRIFALLLAATFGFLWMGSSAASRYVALPALGKKKSPLQIKFEGFQGGRVIAELRNPTNKAHSFKPDGLFFVPVGDPEKAPQRMGAAGYFEQWKAGRWKSRQKAMTLAKGQKVRLRFEVFCLDSHRRSPSNGQRFTVARRRLPKALRRQIQRGSVGYQLRYKSRTRFRSKAQSHIWKTRNKKWIKLQGERKKEATRRLRKRRYRLHRKHRIRHRFRRR